MYKQLSKELIEKITIDKKQNKVNPYAFINENAIRRTKSVHDVGDVLRTPFIKDVDKIINCPFFSRYADKTQVFSLYKNDDISHRSSHVLFVSRIARTIGKALNLNLELIESIALGHDLGHTPFGHAGEEILDKLSSEYSERRFFHNLHSVRVLDKIFPCNTTLQTLDGIMCHDGEFELETYSPSNLKTFSDLDENYEKSLTIGKEFSKKLIPSTLEGCVVRISDIIAYLGKDRQDAEKLGIISEKEFSKSGIGNFNAEIINNLMVNIIENSYGKPYIAIDKECFEMLKNAKAENYQKIYLNDKTVLNKEKFLFPLIEETFIKLLSDLKNGNTSSPIYSHHINYIAKNYHDKECNYSNCSNEQIVIDFIASMTDDYIIDLHKYLFPKSKINAKYKGYF